MTKSLHKITNHSASKYLLSGVLAFGTDYVLLMLTYYALGLPLKLATSIGFFSGFFVSFFLNRQWTFLGNYSKNISRQLIEYIALVIFNYVFTLYTVSLLNDKGVAPIFSKVLIMGMIAVWNYLIFKWIIFSNKN